MNYYQNSKLQSKKKTAELRTIGLCDATDSELSIRQLELTPREGKINFYLSPHSRQTLVTKAAAAKTRCGESSDSLTPSDQSDYELRRNNHCDIILDITNNKTRQKTNQRNNISNTNKMTMCQHTCVHGKTNECGDDGDDGADGAGSCSNSNSGAEMIDNQLKTATKYHSALNRVRNESIVSRSKSFQEQGVRPSIKSSRFFVTRRKINDSVEFNSDTVSHQNIEITVEDIDQLSTTSSRMLAFLPGMLAFLSNDNIAAATARTTMQKQASTEKRWLKEPFRITSKMSSKSSSKTSSSTSSPPQPLPFEFPTYNYVRSWGNGHILGRIFRRMRKMSLGWRKSKCKVRSRGDWDFLFVCSFVFTIIRLFFV